MNQVIVVIGRNQRGFELSNEDWIEYRSDVDLLMDSVATQNHVWLATGWGMTDNNKTQEITTWILDIPDHKVVQTEVAIKDLSNKYGGSWKLWL